MNVIKNGEKNINEGIQAQRHVNKVKAVTCVGHKKQENRSKKARIRDQCVGVAEKAVEKVEQKLQNKKNMLSESNGRNRETNNNKISKNGKIVTIQLSDDEASSDFETVSSQDLKNDFGDFSDLSHEGFIMRIDNELAHKRNRNESNQEKKVEFYFKGYVDYESLSREEKYRSRTRRKSRSESSSSSEERRRYERRQRWSREKNLYHSFRHRRYHYLGRPRNNEFSCKRSQRSSERRTKSKSPTYRDSRMKRKLEAKDGGKFDKVDTLKSNPKRKSYPENAYKCSTDVSKKEYSGSHLQDIGSCSENSRKNNYFLYRKRKRRESSDVSLSPEPVRQKLYDENRRLKCDRKETNTFPHRFRKKESSFSVKKSKKNAINVPETNGSHTTKPFWDQKNTPAKVTSQTVISEVPIQPVIPSPPALPSVLPVPEPNSEVYPPLPALPQVGLYTAAEVIPVENYTGFPTWSIDNLPLVPGPTGLPVHVTATGMQIPYDMEGKRIPIGPNGHYLPLDPFGRLFPHIISPNNIAVPVHLSDDGVLRLPNQEPVPFGPPHQLPVNVDGSIIFIGPDSKPLNPCLNLPKHPFFYCLGAESSVLTSGNGTESQVMQIENQAQNENNEAQIQNKAQNENEAQIQNKAQNENEAQIQNKEQNENEAQIENEEQVENEAQIENEVQIVNVFETNRKQGEPRALQDGLNFLELIQNMTPDSIKKTLLEKYKKEAKQKRENFIKCKEIEKTLGMNSSKSGIKTSTPVKLTLKKSRDNRNCVNTQGSGSDMILDSSDSESNLIPASKVTLQSNSDTTLSEGDEEPKDPIVRKVRQAIKSLNQGNFKPPALGRFILPKLSFEFTEITSPNVSPLLRNQVRLPFLNPLAQSPTEIEPQISKKSSVVFRFLSQKNTQNEKKSSPFRYDELKNRFVKKSRPVFTFDFAMQCDFTSDIIKTLWLKLTELENENVRLKNVNANLVDIHKQIRMNVEKIDREMKIIRDKIFKKNEQN